MIPAQRIRNCSPSVRRTHLAARLVILCLGGFLIQPAVAAQSPWQLLETVKTTMVASLQDADVRADNDKLISVVQRVLLPHVDMHVASQLVLGKHWKSISAAKRDEFKSEFQSYLLRFYTQALAGYIQTSTIPANFMTLEPERKLGDEKIISIQSQITQPRGDALQLAYRLRNHNGWRVIDISLAGISMAQLYRAQFASIIDRDGIDGLITELRTQNGHLAPAL